MSIEDALAATAAELRVLKESVAEIAGRLVRLRTITKVHGEELVHRDTAMHLAAELKHLVDAGAAPASYIGAPGVRDPEHPCAEFSPGSPTDGGCDGGEGHHRDVGHARPRGVERLRREHLAAHPRRRLADMQGQYEPARIVLLGRNEAIR